MALHDPVLAIFIDKGVKSENHKIIEMFVRSELCITSSPNSHGSWTTAAEVDLSTLDEIKFDFG